MPRYVVKPGFTHGVRKQFKAGDVVELTEAEAAGFVDKLQRVGDSQPISVKTDSVPGTPVSKLQVTVDELAKAQAAAKAGNETPPDPNANQNPPPFDVVAANIDDVLAAVKDGKVTANEALIAEQQGAKKRATLIAELTKLVEAESQPPQG